MAATVAPFRGRGEMPRPKVAMRRIKEVLRLKEGLGLSDTAVSRSVRIARSTVKEYLDRAAAVGLNWETVAELSEEVTVSASVHLLIVELASALLGSGAPAA